MLMLHDLQDRFATALISGDASEVAGSIIDDAPGAAARFGIYADHLCVTLIDVLAATFPVVRQLVGDPFFRMVARRYVRAAPPAEPCLSAYGDGFPAFLAQVPEASSHRYLRDVARLEWAINEASHAPDAPAIDVDAATGMIATGFSDLGLRLHPSCGLFASPFPVDRIWQVHQSPCSERGPVDLTAGGVRLLVHRRDDEVGWIELPPAGFALLESITIDGSLRTALTRTRAVDPGFDPAPLLAVLIEGCLIASITRGA